MAELAGDQVALAGGKADEPAASAVAGIGSRIWTVALLGLIALLASVDRQSFSALLTPMKKELHVSDAMMGVLTGTAFTLVYAIVALPLARLIDRTHRRNLLAGAIAFWSVATALCGFASGFLQLLVARFTVGAAEAAQLPATTSMVGDLFPARNRGSALAVIITGSALGFGLGAFLAGALTDSYGWRVALMVVGLPGLLLALLLFLTVREPARGAQDGPGHGEAKENILQCLRRCARIRTIYPFGLGWVLMGAGNAGWLVWGQTFFVRVHHLSNAKAGAAFGGAVSSAIIATVVGGVLSDFLVNRFGGSRWRLYYCAAVLAIAVPFQVASLQVQSVAASVICMIAFSSISGGVTTAATATYVSFAPPTMRAFMSALMTLCSVILGSATAPALYGHVNDILTRTYGDQALRYTLLLTPALLALGGVMLLVASRTLDRDVAAAALPTDQI